MTDVINLADGFRRADDRRRHTVPRGRRCLVPRTQDPRLTQMGCDNVPA